MQKPKPLSKEDIKKIIQLFADGDEKVGICGHDCTLYDNWDEAIEAVVEKLRPHYLWALEEMKKYSRTHLEKAWQKTIVLHQTDILKKAFSEALE